MYWLLAEKPEKDFCCRASGGFVGGLKTIQEFGPVLVSDMPLEIPFPGYVIEKLNDQYHKGKPRPPGDYLEAGGTYIVSNQLRNLLEENDVFAEYYSLDIKAKTFEADQSYFYFRLIPRIACMDRERSEFTEWGEDAGGGVNIVNKLVIDESAIPANMPMLRMDELHVILVSDALKKNIEKSNMSCIHFLIPEEYPKKHEIYGNLVRETTKKK